MNLRKTLFLTLPLLGLWACGSDDSSSVREQARAQVEQMPATPANTAAPNEPEPVRATPPTVDDQLTLSLGNGRGAPGDTVCLPVTVRGFQNLLGWQYTLRWDASALGFFRVQSFNLVDLNESNFGLTNTDRGFFINSWIDNSLSGQTVEDGRAIYEVCFALKGAGGASTEVTFSQNPAPFEVVNTQEDILRFNGQRGVISIE